MSASIGQVLQGQFNGGRFPLPQASMSCTGPSLQARLGGASRPTPVSGNAVLLPAGFVPARGNGQPLPPALQTKARATLGIDSSSVRVHVVQEAVSIGARAFTIGSHLYFAPGEYNPQSPNGQRLIGHELAHVAQQRAGRVRNPFGSGVAIVDDNRLEAEANRLSFRFVASNSTTPVQAKSSPAPSSSIQMWETTIRAVKPDPQDKEIVLYLVNETGSWHGHTALVAEGWEADGSGGGRRWFNTWSFEPADPQSRTGLGGWKGAVPAVLHVRHRENQESGGSHHHLSQDREIGTTYKVTRAQFESLLRVIAEEERLIREGKVKYVGVGHPIGAATGILNWEWHDNCNSWTNKVLRKAGIISRLWGLTWYLPNVPRISAKVTVFGS